MSDWADGIGKGIVRQFAGLFTFLQGEEMARQIAAALREARDRALDEAAEKFEQDAELTKLYNTMGVTSDGRSLVPHKALDVIATLLSTAKVIRALRSDTGKGG